MTTRPRFFSAYSQFHRLKAAISAPSCAYAHDADVSKILLFPRGDLGEEVLNLFEPRMNLLAESYKSTNQRHDLNNSSVSFQLMMNLKGTNTITVKKVWAEYMIIRPTSCHTAAGSLVARAIRTAVFLEKRQRLIDQAGVEVLAQIVFNMTRDAINEAALQKEKEAANRAEAQDLERSNRQLRPGYLTPFGINRFADYQRDAEVENDIRDDAADTDDQRKPVRPKIAREFSQIVHESRTESWSCQTARGCDPRWQLAETFQKASESEILGEIDQTGKWNRQQYLSKMIQTVQIVVSAISLTSSGARGWAPNPSRLLRIFSTQTQFRAPLAL
jgi:hypothetical protein